MSADNHEQWLGALHLVDSVRNACAELERLTAYVARHTPSSDEGRLRLERAQAALQALENAGYRYD